MIKARQGNALRSQCDVQVVYVPLHYFFLRPSVRKTRSYLSLSHVPPLYPLFPLRPEVQYFFRLS